MVATAPDAAPVRRFDSSALVRSDQERNGTPARLRLLTFGLLALFVVVIGLDVAFFQARPTPISIGEGAALGAAAMLILYSGWGPLRKLQSTPDYIALTTDDLEYGRSAIGSVRRYPWNRMDGTLFLTDRRPVREKIGSADRLSLFYLNVGLSLRIPLSEEAFSAIISEVQRRGIPLVPGNFGSVRTLNLGGAA
jgi:hypothetical protein